VIAHGTAPIIPASAGDVSGVARRAASERLDLGREPLFEVGAWAVAEV
jgi:hypothetical protein